MNTKARHSTILIEGQNSPLIASPIIDTPIYHPIQASRERNIHIFRIIDTFANRKANAIDLNKTNTDAKIDEDALPISCLRRWSRLTPKRPSARSRQLGSTAVVPFESHASVAPYGTQSNIISTHFILSIHLDPCLDQKPACGLVAIPGSAMERGPLVLRGGKGGAGGLHCG